MVDMDRRPNKLWNENPVSVPFCYRSKAGDKVTLTVDGESLERRDKHAMEKVGNRCDRLRHVKQDRTVHESPCLDATSKIGSIMIPYMACLIPWKALIDRVPL